MPTSRSAPATLSGPGGAALGLPLGLAAVLVTELLGGPPTVGLWLAAGAAALVAARTTVPGALGAAALCWACQDGFVVNRLGELHGTAPELAALGTVGAAALVARAVGAIRMPRTAGGYPAVAVRSARAV